VYNVTKVNYNYCQRCPRMAMNLIY